MYLLILAIPVALAPVLGGTVSGGSTIVLSPEVKELIAGVLMTISIIGMGIMVYVVNLRMDVVLYARTINAIRKRFYDLADLTLKAKLKTRVLPQSASVLQYLEGAYFGPVVFTFAVFNTLYVALGSLALL